MGNNWQRGTAMLIAIDVIGIAFLGVLGVTFFTALGLLLWEFWIDLLRG
jgi:hypothetical protein